MSGYRASKTFAAELTEDLRTLGHDIDIMRNGIFCAKQCKLNEVLKRSAQLRRCDQIISAGDGNYVARREGLRRYLETYMFMQDRHIQNLELQLASKVATRDLGRKFLKWEEQSVSHVEEQEEGRLRRLDG